MDPKPHLKPKSCLQLLAVEMRKSIFPNRVSLGLLVTLQSKAHAQELLANTKWNPWFFVCSFDYVCVSFHFLLFSFLFSSFLFASVNFDLTHEVKNSKQWITHSQCTVPDNPWSLSPQRRAWSHLIQPYKSKMWKDFHLLWPGVYSWLIADA